MGTTAATDATASDTGAPAAGGGGQAQPSPAGQTASSTATAGQDTASNGSTTVRVGQPGNDGAVAQTNAAGTSSSADASSAGAPPGPQGQGQGPPAGATAGTTQTSPGNANVVVRVGSPGDVGAVGQTNSAAAAASSSAAGSTAADPTAADASSGQPQAQASATATQTSPSNVDVVVRVASPGENGGVTQTNSTQAAADAPPPATPAAAPVAGEPAATDQVVTTTGSSAAVNASLSDQSVDQSNNVVADPADAVGPVAPPQPLAQPGVGTANATQQDATNTVVSVRIGSPGSDGAVVQSNTVAATGSSADLGIVTVVAGTNTNVSVVVPGVASGAPAGDTWTWNWVWDGTWTLPAGATAADVAPTSAATWSWLWSTQPAAAAAASTSASPTATAATPTGTWTWTWTWNLPDGQPWNWTWTQPCACNWAWTWAWDWSKGVPGSTPPQPQAEPVAPTTGGIDTGAVTQTNAVTAEAAASATISASASSAPVVVDAAGDPISSEAPAPGAQSLLALGQLSSAFAQATQSGVWNRNVVWGVATQPVHQSNLLDAAAQSTLEIDAGQAVQQIAAVGDGTTQTISGQQSTAASQVGAAAATATQQDSGNYELAWAPDPNQATVGTVDQANTGSALAAVASWATLTQSLTQLEDVGTASVQSETATQEISSSQVSGALAEVSQLRTWNLDLLLVPAGSRATNPALRQWNDVETTSLAGNLGIASQTVVQASGGPADAQSSDAQQQLVLEQSAIAYSPAAQSDLLNRAQWLGIEPPPPQPVTPEQPAPPMPAPPPAPPAPAGIASAQLTIAVPSGPSLGTSLSISSVALTIVQTRGGDGRHATGETPPTAGLAVPGGCAFACPAAAFAPATAAGETPAGAHDTSSSAAPRRDSGSSPRCSCAATPTPAGSAPAGGFPGPDAAGNEPYRFAAPARIRPQVPASTLGRSMAFLDPFERPG
ncbi:MAG TPA: hypothetical protein VFL60_03540 [Gaiellaceae bacterium]|nr:hypothetical protein [Gaiellaceae bacterium]